MVFIIQCPVYILTMYQACIHVLEIMWRYFQYGAGRQCVVQWCVIVVIVVVIIPCKCTGDKTLQ